MASGSTYFYPAFYEPIIDQLKSGEIELESSMVVHEAHFEQYGGVGVFVVDKATLVDVSIIRSEHMPTEVMNKELTQTNEQTSKTPAVGEELDKEIRKGKPVTHRVEAGDVTMKPVRANLPTAADDDVSSS